MERKLDGVHTLSSSVVAVVRTVHFPLRSFDLSFFVIMLPLFFLSSLSSLEEGSVIASDAACWGCRGFAGADSAVHGSLLDSQSFDSL